MSARRASSSIISKCWLIRRVYPCRRDCACTAAGCSVKLRKPKNAIKNEAAYALSAGAGALFGSEFSNLNLIGQVGLPVRTFEIENPCGNQRFGHEAHQSQQEADDASQKATHRKAQHLEINGFAQE